MAEVACVYVLSCVATGGRLVEVAKVGDFGIRRARPGGVSRARRCFGELDGDLQSDRAIRRDEETVELRKPALSSDSPQCHQPLAMACAAAESRVRTLPDVGTADGARPCKRRGAPDLQTYS